jgi:orotate phosphoribosyltransferase-like protein
MNEIRREAQPLLNPQPATFSRPELHLNPQAVARMRKAEDLFHQGKTRTQIAAELSVPYSTACLLVRGYAGRSKGVHRRDGKPKEWHLKTLELYKQGLNASEISEQLMVEYNTVYQWLRNNADYKPKKRRMGRIT